MHKPDLKARSPWASLAGIASVELLLPFPQFLVQLESLAAKAIQIEHLLSLPLQLGDPLYVAFLKVTIRIGV